MTTSWTILEGAIDGSETKSQDEPRMGMCNGLVPMLTPTHQYSSLQHVNLLR